PLGSPLRDVPRQRLAPARGDGPRQAAGPRHAVGGAPLADEGRMSEPLVAHPWFAAVYDRMTAAAERGFLGRVREELVGSVRGRVLEIGCGTGANFRYYRD